MVCVYTLVTKCFQEMKNTPRHNVWERVEARRQKGEGVSHGAPRILWAQTLFTNNVPTQLLRKSHVHAHTLTHIYTTMLTPVQNIIERTFYK